MLFGGAIVCGFLVLHSKLVRMDPEWVQGVYGYFISWMCAIFMVALTRVVVQESNPASVFTLNLLDNFLLIVILVCVLMTMYFGLQFWARSLKKEDKGGPELGYARVSRRD